MKAFVLVHGVHHLVSEEVKFISDSGSVVEEEALKLVHGVFKGAEVLAVLQLGRLLETQLGRYGQSVRLATSVVENS